MRKKTREVEKPSVCQSQSLQIRFSLLPVEPVSGSAVLPVCALCDTSYSAPRCLTRLLPKTIRTREKHTLTG